MVLVLLRLRLDNQLGGPDFDNQLGGPDFDNLLSVLLPLSSLQVVVLLRGASEAAAGAAEVASRLVCREEQRGRTELQQC